MNVPCPFFHGRTMFQHQNVVSAVFSLKHDCELCSFNIKAWAGPLDVVHYTVDAEDPSNGLCLSMASGAWQGNMLMNQPNPQHARSGASKAEQKRSAHNPARPASMHMYCRGINMLLLCAPQHTVSCSRSLALECAVWALTTNVDCNRSFSFVAYMPCCYMGKLSTCTGWHGGQWFLEQSSFVTMECAENAVSQMG